MTRRRKTRAEEVLDEEDDYEASPATAPETDYSLQALTKDLSVAMQRLSGMERQAFLLKHIEGWRLDEIAESLQINVPAVKHALFRAVKKLRVDLRVWRDEP